MIAQNKKARCTIFAQFFVHFRTRKNNCDIVIVGERNLRKEKMERLETEIKKLEEFADNLDLQIGITRRKKYLKQVSLATIEKKLEKKNQELEEVREFRKKLNEKEKEICAAIEKLQNQKMESIFAQVKRGIKNENLEVSAESVMQMLGVLRKDLETEKSLTTEIVKESSNVI